MKKLLLFVLLLLPIVASADKNGKCGTNVYYTYNETTHTLTIYGEGSMWGWFIDPEDNDQPWRSYSSDIQSVIIESGVTSIGGSAFEGCSSLTSITIPNSVTSIGNDGKWGGWAFSGCKSLTSITIPNSVTYIGRETFGGCTRLTSVNISDIKSWCSICFDLDEGGSANPLYYAKHLYLNGEEIKELIIPNNVTSIGFGAFYNYTGLTSVTIPNSVTSIGVGAFSGCSGLTSVTIPNSVTSIGNGAFSGCSGLTSITIPNSVTSIGWSAFSGCIGLTSIQVESGNQYFDSRNNCNAIIDSNNQLIAGCKNTIIPNSVTSIGNGAFSGCSSLTSITIPDGVTSIGGTAFSGCSGLTSITIPNNVTTIDSDAFWNCTGLVYITLPSKLNNISYQCFGNCNNLIYIYCNAKDVPSAEVSAFINTGNITLYVPSESVDAYKSTSPWNKLNIQTNYYSQGTEKCSKPTISLSDGRFVFNCETPYAGYHWSISTPNGNTGELNYVSHSVTLSVFATKEGYQPSDVATYALSGTPVPASVVGNPVITFSVNIINRSGRDVTLDGDVEFLLGNPDHNGTYLGWEGSYNYTDPIRFSSSPVTLAAGETKTFDGLTWRDEETGSGMGEKSPLDPSQWEASSSNRNVKLYVGGSDEVVVCDNMDPSIIFKEGGIYSIVISSGENTTPINPTPLVGDVNGDGKVNVADHVKLSEIIMEQDK